MKKNRKFLGAALGGAISFFIFITPLLGKGFMGLHLGGPNPCIQAETAKITKNFVQFCHFIFLCLFFQKPQLNFELSFELVRLNSFEL